MKSAPALHPVEPSAAPPLIAVVDDDASFLRSVERLLRGAGYRVASYRSGREFQAAQGGPPPDCLVLDVHLPEMTGLELRDRLAEAGNRLPVVLMTAYDTPQTRERAVRPGTFGLLLKPFDRQELLAALARALSNGPEASDKPPLSPDPEPRRSTPGH